MNSHPRSVIATVVGILLVLLEVNVLAAAPGHCTIERSVCTAPLPPLRQVFHQDSRRFVDPEETAYILPPLKETEEAEDRWIAYDKLQHLSFSFLATLSSQYVLTEKLHWDHRSGPLIVSSGISSAVGISKELYDKRHGGSFSLRDLAADGLGILLASGLVLL